MPETQKYMKTKSLTCYNYNYNNVIEITCSKVISQEMLSYLNKRLEETRKKAMVSKGEDIKDIGNKKNVYIKSDIEEITNPIALNLAKQNNEDLKQFTINYVFKYKTYMFGITGCCKLKDKTKLIEYIESIIKSIK